MVLLELATLAVGLMVISLVLPGLFIVPAVPAAVRGSPFQNGIDKFPCHNPYDCNPQAVMEANLGRIPNVPFEGLTNGRQRRQFHKHRNNRLPKRPVRRKVFIPSEPYDFNGVYRFFIFNDLLTKHIKRAMLKIPINYEYFPVSMKKPNYDISLKELVPNYIDRDYESLFTETYRPKFSKSSRMARHNRNEPVVLWVELNILRGLDQFLYYKFPAGMELYLLIEPIISDPTGPDVSVGNSRDYDAGQNYFSGNWPDKENPYLELTVEDKLKK